MIDQDSRKIVVREDIPAEFQDFLTNRWSRTVVQPLLTAVMISCLFAPVFLLIEALMPGSSWLPFTWLILLVALEGNMTTLWLRRPRQVGLDQTRYRASELVLLLLLTRFTAWLITGSWPSWQLFGEYLRYPLLLFNDLPFIIGLIIVLIAWQRAVFMSSVFTRLALSPAEVYYYSQAKNKRDSNDRPIPMRRADIVFAFFQQWISGGIIIILVTALTSFDIQNMDISVGFRGVARLGLPPELLIALILYFLTGFMLLSQGRLAAMNAKWLHEGVKKTPAVERSWHRYTLWLIAGGGGLALLVPLGSTKGISAILVTVIGWITYLYTFIFSLLLTLLALLFSGGDETVSDVVETIEVPPSPLPTPAPSTATPPSEVAGIIFSSAFWTLALVFGGLALLFFIRERGITWDREIFGRMWRSLRSWLSALFQGVSEQAGKLRDAVQERLQRDGEEGSAAGGPNWRFLRLNSLSPRERIWYFYLSTVKRAAEGVVRGKAETPLEFTADLKAEWPEAEEDLDALTDAFLAARYSRREPGEEDVNPVKKRWRQVKSSLRRRKR